MMKNRKIGIILLLVVFLPALFFSVYEIGSLNRNEKIIEEIYNNQLDVIIFSVNTYSEDIASGWAMNLNNVFAYPQYDLTSSLKRFTFNNPSIKGVFYASDTSYNNIDVVMQDYSISAISQQTILKKVLHNNSKVLDKLFQYIKGGYRKIVAFNSPQAPGLSYFVFAVDSYHGHEILCGLVIDAQAFVKQVLSPKIQAVAEESFIISVMNEHKNEVIYISEPNNLHRVPKYKSLWLLPNFKLGIIYKNKTIEQLVRERTYVNFLLILLLDVLFLTGTWYVFRSIKTQIQLAQMRADFISNVSHEIRTPLALISVYIETILLGRLRPEKLQEYYQIIYQETNRLTAIVNKILNFSRIEEKKYNYNFTSLNLNEIVENVLQRYDYHLKNKNFETRIELSQNLPFINADREALYEVLMNLIDNAIKYSKDQKFLSVTTTAELNKVILEVTDKGIGIPENQQKFVFDKFFRVSDGEVQNIRGSGLGLAIVKHIMDRHNATILLNSIQGKGSTFKVIFQSLETKDKESGENNIKLEKSDVKH
ncbi:MAG TPA: ATP-binding protein [Bacteroidales bacterium]|jgi:Osmosensitive K+ channel histidine kinase